jgi:hypothetical protein
MYRGSILPDTAGNSGVELAFGPNSGPEEPLLVGVVAGLFDVTLGVLIVESDVTSVPGFEGTGSEGRAVEDGCHV